jgi:hypothetical protein
VEQHRILSHEEIMKQTPGFQVIWDLAVRLERMSAQRERARFEWVSQPE